MVVRGCFLVENVKRGFVVKERCREAIDEVSGSKNTFPSKFYWQIRLKTKGSCSFKEMAVFAFDNSILLGVYKRKSVDKLSHGQKRNCAWRKILSHCQHGFVGL